MSINEAYSKAASIVRREQTPAIVFTRDPGDYDALALAAYKAAPLFKYTYFDTLDPRDLALMEARR